MLSTKLTDGAVAVAEIFRSNLHAFDLLSHDSSIGPQVLFLELSLSKSSAVADFPDDFPIISELERRFRNSSNDVRVI